MLQFLYCSDEKGVDITKTVFEKCLFGDHIYIAIKEGSRNELFGDPAPGKNKYINVINNGISKKYDENTAVSILLEVKDIDYNVEERNIWWNTIGKHIKDPNEKVNELHKRIDLRHGSLKDEYPEQLMNTMFIKPADVVLELGSNIGRSSCIIAQILDDDTKFVTMESSPQHVKEVTENRDLNGYHFNIEPSALSKRNLIQRGWDTIVSDIVHPGYFKVNTISWSALKEKYKLDFTVLVADCEGALFFILQDEPELLKGFHTVIMENDYKDIRQKEYVDSHLYRHGFKPVLNGKGGWGPCYNFFYQVWQKTV